MKIELPSIQVKTDVKGHPYPMQISFQTMQLMHASMFHTAFFNVATSQYIRQNGALAKIKEEFA